MGKFDNILLCTDLDGTLYRRDKSISDENVEAIEYFKKEGGYFTFITGRMPFSAKDVYEKTCPNCPFGCINGGGVYDHRSGEYKLKIKISREVLELVEFVDREIPEMGIQINTFDNIYFSKDNSAMELFRKLTGAPFLKRHYNDVDEDIAKILFADMSGERILALAELLRSHPLASRFDFVRSEKTLYEILPKGVSKATSLDAISSLLSTDRTVAVGDYSNDVEMIKRARVGIAVANATEDTKAAADYITVTNEENAIARIIKDIEDKKILGL